MIAFRFPLKIDYFSEGLKDRSSIFHFEFHMSFAWSIFFSPKVLIGIRLGIFLCTFFPSVKLLKGHCTG